jgi:hypothetical protein
MIQIAPTAAIAFLAAGNEVKSLDGILIAGALGSLVALLVFRALPRLRQWRRAKPFPHPPDDGHLRIRDLTPTDVLSGRNWKVSNRTELLLEAAAMNLEDVHIEATDSFAIDEVVVYSALFVTENGIASPLLLIREVGDFDYGGDYCELHNGKWRQVGLVPNPNAPHGTECIANPLEQDPSFTTLDGPPDRMRIENRENFLLWANKLKSAGK